MKIDLKKIQEHKSLLENHSLLVTNTIQSMDDLRTFMEHHVFAVWDFMSLLKTLQHNIVPSTTLWLPNKGNRSDVARMINEIVVSEESDISLDGRSSSSHFDLYLQAMMEIGANTCPILEYLDKVNDTKIHWGAPGLVQPFIDATFNAIKNGPHCVAASFCYGRENVIPTMFKKILKQLNVSALDAPKFHYYLERHIEIDADVHGPMSEQLVNYFTDNNPVLVHEAEETAIKAIKARIKLFDDIEAQLI